MQQQDTRGINCYFTHERVYMYIDEYYNLGYIYIKPLARIIVIPKKALFGIIILIVDKYYIVHLSLFTYLIISKEAIFKFHVRSGQ